MSPQKLTKYYKKIIDKELKKYLNPGGAFSAELYSAMQYVVFPGGKRLRPILCLLASRICGGGIQESLKAACALELIHNFSLVHDDLPSMDNDDYRRGKLTCHKKFGEAIAILAGDALFNKAYEIISGINNKDMAFKIIKLISNSIGVRGMISGQAMDIKYQNKRITKSQEKKINELKTGKLFEASVASGAICASAPGRVIGKMKVFGKIFGEAFQVYDDICDKKCGRRQKDKEIIYLNALIKKAKSALDIFGKKAHNLVYIVNKLSYIK